MLLSRGTVQPTIRSHGKSNTSLITDKEINKQHARARKALAWTRNHFHNNVLVSEADAVTAGRSSQLLEDSLTISFILVCTTCITFFFSSLFQICLPSSTNQRASCAGPHAGYPWQPILFINVYMYVCRIIIPALVRVRSFFALKTSNPKLRISSSHLNGAIWRLS